MGAIILARLPGSAIAMLVIAASVLYGGIAICLVLAAKRKP